MSEENPHSDLKAMRERLSVRTARVARLVVQTSDMRISPTTQPPSSESGMEEE